MKVWSAVVFLVGMFSLAVASVINAQSTGQQTISPLIRSVLSAIEADGITRANARENGATTRPVCLDIIVD